MTAALPAGPAFDTSALYEQVLRERGMSAEGARAVAHDASRQRAMDERRADEVALRERMARLAAATEVDVEAVAAIIRDRDANVARYATRVSDGAIAVLRGLSPADRRVFAGLLVSTRGGFVPVAPSPR